MQDKLPCNETRIPYQAERTMNIIAFGKTDTGLRRSNNEDAFLTRPDLGFSTVVDGVGGAAAGEIASRIFVETAGEIFDGKAGFPDAALPELIQESFRLGNDRILAHAEAHPDCRGMACTAELIAFAGDGYIIGHVGDSRTYLYREGGLRQVTKDHSLVQSQVDQGLITREAAKTHALRNVVLRAVGTQPSIELDIVRGKILPDDIFLLCSDGLTDMVEDEDIRQILTSASGLDDKVDRLIEAAKSAGGHDNITVVLCRVLSE
jgi:protein phosphatase